jgi:hypothetical protein
MKLMLNILQILKQLKHSVRLKHDVLETVEMKREIQ